MTQRRLIEETFPLKKVSEDSKHEKNVRHGHISTLHIWPARRPLAACRAAIIASLLPDPGDEKSRHELNKKIESITRWGSENGPALDFFRQEIRKAYGGRAPRVLDMFAGGGAIPLEAMRLGCDVTAIDYNPVAWFILKCTLEFPQRLAGKTWPLPQDKNGGIRDDDLREQGVDYTMQPQAEQLNLLGEESPEYRVQGDLADHVRYWGQWVLARAREELAPYYPTIDGQPTVAYLWARTVPCPDPACGAEAPLLKTLWLSQKAEKTLPDTPENRARPDFLRIQRTKNTSKVVINGRRALRLVPHPRAKRVDFEIWTPGPKDKVLEGTMAGAKSQCPVCGVQVPADYIKKCGRSDSLGQMMIAVAIDAAYGRDYRSPIDWERETACTIQNILPGAAQGIPHGLLDERLPTKDRHRAVGSQLPDYGFDVWSDIYTSRQLFALLSFARFIRDSAIEMRAAGYPDEWIEVVVAYLAMTLDRLADQATTLCLPDPSPTQSGVVHTFARFALPMTWDFIEGVPISNSSGSFERALDWVVKVLEHLALVTEVKSPEVICGDATVQSIPHVDLIVTDPPYYDAIPYSDISDFFYVWLRRVVGGYYSAEFRQDLSPKSKEIVQQKKGGSQGIKGKARYEQGMADAFRNAASLLLDEGRMVIVFAHKEPDAWETLVSAMIQSGFTVTASWPIDTERQTRMQSINAASLASSIWLVCRKRHVNAGVGRYTAVRRAMQERVTERLRYFWDIGISGPDFVWAAVGPALESYSSHDEVRRLDGSLFTVGEFLREVRRLVADFALGQILKGHSTEGLDEWTRYYLMHRNSFGMEGAPAGECILFAQGYGLDLNELRGPRGFLVKATGSDLRLIRWHERIRADLGQPHPSGGLPLIDVLHRMLHLWAAGNLDQLSTYAAERGLRQNELFWSVAQAILEMAEPKSRERALLEAVVAWGRGKTPTQMSYEQAPLSAAPASPAQDANVAV